MPIIFLSSALVFGSAMVTLLYQIGVRLSGPRVDPACLQSLARWLWLFIILTVSMELLEILTLAYERADEWAVIEPLLRNQLALPFFGLQIGLGALVPIILLGIVVLMSRYLTDRTRSALCFVSSLLLLLQVFVMRWNVVIGGQIFSKSLRGFREAPGLALFEKEGVAPAILVFVLPLVFVVLFNRVLPVLEPRAHQP